DLYCVFSCGGASFFALELCGHRILASRKDSTRIRHRPDGEIVSTSAVSGGKNLRVSTRTRKAIANPWPEQGTRQLNHSQRVLVEAISSITLSGPNVGPSVGPRIQPIIARPLLSNGTISAIVPAPIVIPALAASPARNRN